MTSEKEANVSLQSLSLEPTLNVDISDALSERDKVKYTVHTKTDIPEFEKTEISIVREHEEFIWLHYCLETNQNYAGYIVPPAPPRPDFNMLREKLQKLCEEEATMAPENFLKLKQELEQEYLAMFKKTVAMHEMFLCRLASHPIFIKNIHFRAFLKGDNELFGRGKSKKEAIGSFIKRISQTADEVLLSGQRDVDDFFEREKNHLVHYHNHLKDATAKADKVCESRKYVSYSISSIAMNLAKISEFESSFGDEKFGFFLHKMADAFEKLKKIESRVGSDEELKEADTLRYFTRELQAGKELLYRRLRCLANYENANKNMERARLKSRVALLKAEFEEVEARKKFAEISNLGKAELIDLTKRRVDTMKKNLTDLADLEIKQSKAKISIIKATLESIKDSQNLNRKLSNSVEYENQVNNGNSIIPLNNKEIEKMTVPPTETVL